MNLVSYEYVAAQNDRHGVLILSEFAGAAQSLNGALIINPWNTPRTSPRPSTTAVTMPAEQRDSNFQKLRRYVYQYNQPVVGAAALSTSSTATKSMHENLVSAAVSLPLPVSLSPRPPLNFVSFLLFISPPSFFSLSSAPRGSNRKTRGVGRFEA